MPNHITNVLEFVAETKESIKELQEFVRSDSPQEEGADPNAASFDFEKIVPPPANLFREDMTLEKERDLAEQGIPTWYDWNRQNWGTKWNAYSHDNPDRWMTVAQEDTLHCWRISFNTAWAPPTPVIEALMRRFPDVLLRHTWHDEGGGGGILMYHKGELIYDVEEDESPEIQNFVAVVTQSSPPVPSVSAMFQEQMGVAPFSGRETEENP